MTTSTVQALMGQVSPIMPCSFRGVGEKVSIIGAGSVGASCLYTLVAQRISSELVLIDKDISLARDELNDIENASVFMDQPKLTFSSDYENTKNSKVIVITAGESIPLNNINMEVLRKNVDIYKEIIPQIMSYNSKFTLLVVTKPVDLMSYVAWKLSGLPPFRVIGTGCSLLSAHFRQRIAEKVGVSANVVQGCIVGENGPNCVPVWSAVTVAGVRLRDISPKMGTDNDPEDWDVMFRDIIRCANNVIRTKSFNTWATAAAVAKIISVITFNTRECISVSTHIKGGRTDAGKDKDVYLSMPCILSSNGVSHIVRQKLNQIEKEKLQKSADDLNQLQWQFQLI